MELNFSELMADPQAFERFMKARDRDLTGEETQKMIRAPPGVRAETQETVTMRSSSPFQQSVALSNKRIPWLRAA